MRKKWDFITTNGLGKCWGEPQNAKRTLDFLQFIAYNKSVIIV